MTAIAKSIRTFNLCNMLNEMQITLVWVQKHNKLTGRELNRKLSPILF